MSNSTEPRNLLVIKASAGSGKTYRLALEYIGHLLFTTADDGTMLPRRAAGVTRQLNTHRQLLAITFTNKATDEMKARIVKELYRLSRPGTDSDYLAGFVEQSSLSESRVRELARLALNELLFDYSNFNVSTIDSFFQSILRNFARELDRDYNYDIQIDDKYAVRVAVHDFLLNLGREGMPTDVNEWFKDHQRHLLNAEGEKMWKIFRDDGDLFDVAVELNTELFRLKMDAIRDYLGAEDEQGHFKCDFSRIRDFRRYILEQEKRCDDNIEVGYEQLRAALAPLESSLKGSFKSWLAKEENTPFDLQKTWKVIDEEKIQSQFKVSSPADSATVSRLLSLMKDHRLQRYMKDFFKRIGDTLGDIGLLAMIDLFLERYRHESNTILISDTNELIGAVLDSGSEFVYERVGTTIDHFMIDEFQDTSAKQYENFRGLLRESLGCGHFNMLIGDSKQSIYRFRNADITVFRDQVGRDFAADVNEPAVEPGKPRSTNYRSSRRIIEFNNNLFRFIMNRFNGWPDVGTTYGDVEQGFPEGIDEKKVPGYVRLLTGQYNRLMNDEVIKEAYECQHGSVNNEEPVTLVDVLPGYLLRLHERYEWGRIGILVNTHAQGNQVVQCVLDYNRHTTGETISIISDESLLLANSPVIRRIISMLRFIDICQFAPGEDADDKDDEVETAAARNLRSKRESDQRLYAAMNAFVKDISMAEDASPVDIGSILVRSLDSQDDVTREALENGEEPYANLLKSLLPPGDELTTLVSIVETIIAYIKNDQGEGADVDRETAFLMAFQDTVLNFASQGNGGSVREFLKFWDEKKDKLAVSSSGGGDAINIMTIHAAKGLEFDCVIIPFADWMITDEQKAKPYWMPGEVFVDVLKSLPLGEDAVLPQDVPPLLSVSKSHLVHLSEDVALRDEAAAYLAKQRSDVLIENLNKTYVAFTRPCTELHIFSQPNDNKELDKKICTLLSEYVAEGGMTPMAGAEDAWFEYGSISSRDEIIAKRPVKQIDEIQCDITDYPVMPMPPAIRVKLDNASGLSIEAGRRMHSLLSRISERNDLERVISEGVKHGVLTDDPDDPCNVDRFKAHVVGPMLDPGTRIAAWFDPANRVYSERTITTASGSLFDPDGIENMRPDRIVRRPDGQMFVIDYKSGERRDRQYCRQVQRYINQLHAIYPDAPIAGRIWYVTLGLLIDEKGSELSLNL